MTSLLTYPIKHEELIPTGTYIFIRDDIAIYERARVVHDTRDIITVQYRHAIIDSDGLVSFHVKTDPIQWSMVEEFRCYVE